MRNSNSYEARVKSVSQTVLAFVLAGGKGTRLEPMTSQRSKPAVPFGARYRIIDFVLSNLINSNIYSAYVLTQYLSQSLAEHLHQVWNFGSVLPNLFVTPVPAQQRTGGNWYQGTADAVWQNVNLINDFGPDYMAIFGGDHIFLMDVRQMLRFARKRRAEVCIACIPVPIAEAHRFGVVQVDEEWRITGFQEKPKDPTPLPGDPTQALISMGNYIFETGPLLAALSVDAADEQSSHDFGSDVLPRMLAEGKQLYAYDFMQNVIPGSSGQQHYWRDVGTIEAYFEACMDLRSVTPLLDIYNAEWPIRAETTNAPPVKFVHNNMDNRIGQAHQSVIAEGTIISGATIVDSLVGRNCRFNSYSHVDHCVIMDDVIIKRNARLQRCIIDKHVIIPENDFIGFDPAMDRKRFTVTDSGIVIIPKNTEVKPLHHHP
jgi:glucose-1-phosphate adenylyltransferase